MELQISSLPWRAANLTFYPEYTGTAWNMVLKKDGLYTEDMFTELESEYEDSLGMSWVGMYGFNNTYGLVVRKEIADKYNIKTYSDLRAVSDKLIFGAEYDFFEREDGYDALCSEYGFNFKRRWIWTLDSNIRQSIRQDRRYEYIYNRWTACGIGCDGAGG